MSSWCGAFSDVSRTLVSNVVTNPFHKEWIFDDTIITLLVMKVLKESDARCKAMLSDQHVSELGPGTIIRDVEALLKFIGTNGLSSGSKLGNLPTSALSELNILMSDSINLPLRRPLLKHYPNIAGPYILCRVMGLIQLDGSQIRIHEDQFDQWNSLNDTEKYFSLVEAWLIHGNDDVLGGEMRHREPNQQFNHNLDFLALNLSSSHWTSFKESVHTYSHYSKTISAWNAQLQMKFGLIKIKTRPAENRTNTNRGWMMEKAKFTDWGVAVVWAILKFIKTQQKEDLAFMSLPPNIDFGYLQPAFQSYFPDWQSIYSLDKRDFQAGIYVFKTTIESHDSPGKVWRRFAIPDQASLDEMAGAILAAFEFDDTDHGYEFQFRDPRGINRFYYHPFMGEGPFADEIRLGDTGLSLNQVMKFVFDHSWHFEIKLEQISPNQERDKPIEIIEGEGEPPRQYPEF